MTRSAAVFAALALTAAAQSVHTVSVPCCQFVDSVSLTSVTTVPAGTTVRWVLSGLTNHTVTSGAGPTAPGAGSLFNGSLGAATPQFQFTFNTPGTFPYFCSPHFPFGMVGTVFVTQPASATTNGTGCSGSSGLPLTLSANGLPTLGNAGFGLTVTNGPASGTALWYAALGAQSPPILLGGNCFLYLDLVTLQVFVAAGITPVVIPLSPTGSATLPFPVSGSIAPGTRLDIQVACPDSPAPGFVSSNALVLLFGS